jgi:hypothetical protein
MGRDELSGKAQANHSHSLGLLSIWEEQPCDAGHGAIDKD